MLVALLSALAVLGPAEPSEEVPEPPAQLQPPSLPEPPAARPGTDVPPMVQWTAPPTCPGPGWVHRGIERRLGRPLASGEVAVEGQVTATAEGFVLELHTAAGELSESRRLEATDCLALADATALVVALTVDPVAVAEVLAAAREVPVEEEPLPPPQRPEAEAELEPEPSPAASPEPPAETTPREPSEETSRRLEGGLLRLTAGLGLGATPGATGAFTLVGGLQWRRARLELQGSYWLPRRTAPLDGATVSVQLGAAGVRGCGQLRRDRIEAPLCGGLQLGGMRGEGAGVPGARPAQGLWLALEASVGLSWWIRPRWALAGGFAAAVPLVQPAFEVGRSPAVRLFEPSPVAGRLWLGVETRLGRR
ncbi:MAG: hypothetical protein H6712_13640 [Myxococcales bacterium]|nr:hypothetical protein [Myxococcales bacterium]